MTQQLGMAAALEAVAAWLEALPAPAMVIGGVAVIAHGVARQTRDIDVTVRAGDMTLSALIEAAAAHAITPRIPHAEEFARSSQVLLLSHGPTGTPVDASMAWLPFEDEALARASWTSLGKVRVRVATAQDLVIYKAVAWRERDRDDIERLLALHAGVIDLESVRQRVTEFAEALDAPERVVEFERLLARSIPK